MSVWGYITTFFSMLSPYAPLITGVGGTIIGSLFTYFWNQYTTQKQAQANAITTMVQDEDAHASDGSVSVGDMQSVQAQDADLKQQLAAIDAQAAQANQQKQPQGVKP